MNGFMNSIAIQASCNIIFGTVGADAIVAPKLHWHISIPNKKGLRKPTIPFVAYPSPQSTVSFRGAIRFVTAPINFDSSEFLLELLVLRIQLVDPLLKRIHSLFSAGTEFFNDLWTCILVFIRYLFRI